MIKTVFSRYGDKRIWKLVAPNLIELTAYEVLDYRILGKFCNIQAVDPDGGPFIRVGSSIEINDCNFTILKIRSHILDNATDIASFIFEVEQN